MKPVKKVKPKKKGYPKKQALNMMGNK